MVRLVLAIVAAMALSGCQHSGQQAIDPFWGRTTVPAPPTGSIGAPIVSPGCQQPLIPQVTITPGTPLSNSGSPPGAPPNLLPAPMSSVPGGTGAVTPIPPTPGLTGSGAPYGYGTPAITSPPPVYPAPSHAPPSGYANPDSSASGTPGSPAVPAPGSAPAGTYPSSPALPTAPGGMAPPAGGATPMGPCPGLSSPTGPTPAPAGSPPASTTPSSPPPGYFPPDGDYRYHGSTQRPSERGHWVAPSGVATTPAGLGGATVSTPPGTTPGAGLDAGPSVVRIPTIADGGWAATPASAEISAAPTP